MARRTYSAALKKALDGASADQFAGRTAEELSAMIADMTEVLRGPMSDASRIMLCADREAARKAYAALTATEASA